MTKLSVLQRSSALSLVLMLAASSVPATGAPAEDDPSGSITVGVVIEEEPNECTDASLEINAGYSDLVATLGDGDYDYMDVPELNPYDLMTFAFRSSDDPFAAFADSIGMSEDEASAVLMNNGGDFPIPEEYRPNVADLDDNGFISVENPDDIPTFLEAAISVYYTDDFVVNYDAGSCLGDSQVSYGLLSVSGNPLYKLDEGTNDWQFAGITDFNADNVSEYNGKGEAHLWAAYDSENQQSLSSSEIDFGETFAKYGGTSNVSFAATGTEVLNAQVDIAGTQTVGQYRVTFDFDLEVGDQSYMTSLCNSAINSYFTLEPCT